jgi:hypothetical protein
MRALRERQLADIRGVLTPAQQQRFDANRKQLEARMREHRGHRSEAEGRGRQG